MTTQVEALAMRLRLARFECHLADGGRPRIHLHGFGRALAVYIVLDHPERDAAECTGPMGLFACCALKVVFDSSAGGRMVDRAKRTKHTIMQQLVADGIAPGPVCTRWQDIIL